MKTMNEKNMCIFSVTILLITIFFPACTSFNGYPKNLLTISGMIYDLDNKPVPDVRITMNERPIASSDINGHFTLPTLVRGKTYSLCFIKANYETISLSFTFTDPSKVIYIKMASGQQLLAEAEKQLKLMDWQHTLIALDRAEKTDCNQTELAYLRASYFYARKDYIASYGILTKLISSGADDPYILLFAADLAQYRLNDLEAACTYLTKFLDARFDSDIENRLNQLNHK